MNQLRQSSVRVDDGAHLWTMSSGPLDAPPVVLLHGGPGLWDNLGPIAESIDEDHRTHRYDHRACARSTGPEDYRLARAVADLEELRRHWGHDRWTVFGHSFGATLALAYAWTHPDRVRSIVYCSGVGPGREWKAPYHAEADRRLTPTQRARLDELERRERSWDEEIEFRTLSWLPNYADPKAAAAWLAKESDVPYRINFAANRQLAADDFDVVALGKDITAPVLIIHGEEDPRPLSNVRRLLDILPNATLATISKAGHSPWQENPTEFSARLTDFLASVHS